MSRRVRIAAVALIVALFTAGSSSDAASSAGDPVSGEIVVWFFDESSPAFEDSAGVQYCIHDDVQTILASYGFISAKPLFQPTSILRNVYLLAFPDTVDMEDVCDDLSLESEVRSVGRNIEIGIDACFTTDPALCGDFLQTGLGDQWAFRTMQVDRAWDITKGSSDVTVAVMDVGIAYDHPDLKANMWINAGEDHNGNGTFEAWDTTLAIDGVYGDLNGRDDDGNAYIDDVVGYEFHRDSHDTNPHMPCLAAVACQHGTLMASIISADTDNGIGVAGLTWHSRIMALGAINHGTVIEATNYAIDNGADVVNMSFSVPFPDPGSEEVWEECIRRGDSLGVIFVSSAGNNGAGYDLANGYVYPQIFEPVIAVAAVDSLGYWSTQSSYDSTVAVSGPSSKNAAGNPDPIYGIVVCSTGDSSQAPWYPTDDPPYIYGYTAIRTSGTSALVSGVFALLKAAYPDSASSFLKAEFERGEVPLPADEPKRDQLGQGMANAYRALTQWGHVSSNTVWSGDVYVSGDVVVDSAVTLTVNPGTNIWIMPDDVNWAVNPSISPTNWNDTLRVEFWVKGNLDCNGTALEPVTIKAWDPSGESNNTDDWYGLHVWENEGAGADFDHVVIKNAIRGIQSRSFINVRNTLIEKCELEGINIASADTVFIDSTTIDGAEVAGLVLGSSTARIDDSTIKNTQEYAALVRNASTLYADGTTFLDADIGVYAFPDTEVTATAHLEDCTIRDAETGVRVDDDGFVTLSACRIEGASWGVVSNDGDIDLSDTFVSSTILCVDINGGDCTLDGDSLTASGPNGSCVFIDDMGDGVSILNVAMQAGLYGVNATAGGGELIIENCSITGAAQSGVYVAGTDSTHIDSCEVSQNKDGIVVYGDRVVLISNNTIDDNDDAGIWLNAGADDVTLEGNVITDNTIGVYCLSGTDAVIRDENEIEDNTTGIKCESGSHPYVRSNYIRDNGTGVSAVTDSDPSLGGSCSGACGAGCSSTGDNVITGSTNYHVANFSAGVTILAECNYWNSPGKGCPYTPKATKIYGSVDVCPALGTNPLASSGPEEEIVEHSHADLPKKFNLAQNYPNPFNPSTRINYDVPVPGAFVEIDVYDVSGALVRRLVREQKSPGFYHHIWDGLSESSDPVATGVYFVRMNAGTFNSTIKLVLLK